MQQVLVAGTADPPQTAATEYNGIQGGTTWATEAERTSVVAAPGKLRKLRIKLTVAPGGAASYTFTLSVNGIPSLLTVPIVGAAVSGSNIVNEIAVAAGDTVVLVCVPAGAPAGTTARWTMEFLSTNPNESLLLSAGFAQAAGVRYVPMQSCDAASASASEVAHVVPTGGTLKKLYVVLNGAPGAGTSYVITVRKNVADSIITCTVANLATTASDLVNTLAVVAGDIISIKIAPTGAPTNRYAWIGLLFAPTIDGESCLGFISGDALNNAAVEYNLLMGGGYGTVWSNVEANYKQLGQLTTLKKLQVAVNAAPGAGKSWTFVVRQNGASPAGGLSAVITGAAVTTGSDNVNSVAVANDDDLNMMLTPAGAPAAAVAYWGLAGYIAPTGAAAFFPRGPCIPCMMSR